MKMEFLQLRYFYESAKSLAKTAEKFMVPASSVSASIKRLEKELGTELFDRSANRIKLNERGHLLAESLGELFEKLDSSVSKIAANENRPKEICIVVKARRKWITELIIETVIHKITAINLFFISFLLLQNYFFIYSSICF